MSSVVLKYTAKLNSNLNVIKKRVTEIRKLAPEERNAEIVRLYRYFTKETDSRVKLFDDDYNCNTSVLECINRDINMLKSKCDTHLKQDERKEYCLSLVYSISNELMSIINSVTREATGETPEEYDYVDSFMENLLTETPDKNRIKSFKYLV